MITKEFYDLIHLAFIDPLPKKLVVIFAGLIIFYFVSRIGKVRDFFTRFFSLPIPILLGTLLCLAIFLRITFVVSSPTYFATSWEDTQVVHDESSLINIYSVSIAETDIPVEANGQFSMRRSLGYTYLIGFLYRIFGYSNFLFCIVQIIMGTALVALMFWFVYIIFGRISIAWCVAFMMAIYPQNIISSNILLDEYPFFLFIFTALPLAALNLKRGIIKYNVVIGLLLGLATFCRTHALFFPLIFMLAYRWRKIPIFQCIKSFIIMLALVFLINTPYAYMVYRNYGTPSFSPAYGSVAFYGTLNDQATWHNGYLPMTEEEGGDKVFFEEKNPVLQAKIARRLAAKWVVENPIKTVQFFIMRNFMLFGFHMNEEMTNLHLAHAVHPESSFAYRYNHVLRKTKSWAYAFVAILALLGLMVLLFDRSYRFFIFFPGFTLILLIILYWIGLHGLFFGFRKYRWLMDLLLMPPASFFIWWLTCRFGNKSTQSKCLNK